MEPTIERRSRMRAFEALQHRDFRLLFLGQAVSLVGDAAFLTALAWRTFSLVGSSKLGVVLVCQSVALLATVLVGGALADRFSRRRMMIVSDLARFVAVAGLALVDASGHLTFGWIIVFAVAMGLGDGLFYPAFGGMVPLVVDKPMIASANALIGVARWGSILLGPAIAGLLYTPAGSATVFAVDAASFLVSATLVWKTRPRRFEADEHESTLQAIAGGARYVAGVPWLWVTIALFALVLMLQFAPQQVLLPKLVDEQWHRGVGAYALLTTLLGVGTVAGTLAFGQLQPRRRRGVITYALFVVNSLVLAVFALSPWYPLAGALSVVRGVCIGFGVAIWETMLMELVPDQLLSRVVSLDFFGSFGLMPVGLAVSAAVASMAPPDVLLAGGAGLSAVLIAIPLTRPWLRAVD
ncbi:MAG TPA: MFS transporter [Gaiellaceae bacterium]|nr:MFS transporter [Gaiellaceae bacterium]